MSGGMFLCWGCQHTFPESIVEKIDISEDLEGHFNCVQARLARLRDMRPQTGAERLRRTVAELEADFRQLVLAVRKDARLLKEERELLAMERRDLEERQRDGAQNGAGVISADGDELSCIITVGSEQSSTDAAQRCAAAQGTVGAAVTTGIALNLGVPEHFATASDGHVTPPRSDDDGDEHVSFNLLCFPVAAKYRAFARRVPEGSEGNWRGSGCIGALQLINKNGGETPFSAADEAACLGACAVISHVLSNYRSALSGAASKKVFDAGPLRKAAAFVATSGSQARKAVPMMEAVEAHQPSQLIYRCSRQQVRATRKGDMLSTRCEVAVANRIKDMQREHVLHEIAYKKCVKEKEEQKSQKEELAEQLIQLRRDLMDARSQGSRRLSLSANPGAGEQKGKSRERGGAPRKSAFIDSGLGASIAVASGADRTPRHLSATVPAGRRPSFV